MRRRDRDEGIGMGQRDEAPSTIILHLFTENSLVKFPINMISFDIHPRSIPPSSLLPLSGILVGSLAIADTIKPEAPVAVSALRDLGLDVILLTGDNRRTAQAIAQEVGIQYKNIYAEVLPSHKKNKVSELQRKGRKV